MTLINKVLNTAFAPRRREIEKFKEHPIEVQAEQFARLIEQGSRTQIGAERGLLRGTSYSQFVRKMPIIEYADMEPYVDRIRAGEKNVLSASPVRWLAKSSGTTNSKSKYIPVTVGGLSASHTRGPKDVMAIFCHTFPSSHVLDGKMLTLGGSKKLENDSDKILAGDLSSILIDNTPRWASWLRMPSKRTALLADFDEKVRRICEESINQDIRSFSGVPSWNLVMLNRVLEYTGKQNILEVWPNMELFVHGGMNFGPYKEQFAKIIPSLDMKYMETYNASEGFFALAEEPYTNEMLLMLDYETFYEFLPTDSLDNPSRAVPLEGVRTGVNYAMIITSSNGLWRYMIGDTVEFTSTSPYKIRITGRTKLFVNAFGEEIIIDNADRAMAMACAATNAEVGEYTMAPVYMSGREKGAHEWIVEFHHQPSDMAEFTQQLDKALQQLNSDYEAKRKGDTTLHTPIVRAVPKGSFMEWLRSEGRFGGQCKVPRLSNDRKNIESLKAFLKID